MTRSPLFLEVPERVEGPRVLLRPYVLEDAPALRESVDESREHLTPWMPWAERSRSVEDAAATILRSRARWILREDLMMGIFERSTGRHLGGTGLHRMDWKLRGFEIGYWLRKTVEGRGFATETVQVLTRMAFETLDAVRVEIRMDTRNHRSRVVPERLGFVHEGTLRNASLGTDGTVCSIHVYALLREDFDRLQWR
ncbi:MAG: GNAT family N-acetyltransferase [Chloroflexota bacterium]|nr:GNAT family N-acetyltransferase [Chloroflexota bacterium]